MTEDLVSIVIPVYNTGKYLKECVESVLCQDYRELELILIDDGSTDNSYKVCLKLAEKDQRVHVYHQANGGVSKARNTGIDHARGKYLMFIDSDDYLISKSTITEFMNNLQPGKIVISDFSRGENAEYEGPAGIICYEKEGFTELYLEGMMNSPYCKLYEREIIEKNNVCFDESLCLGEDLLFNIQYMRYISEGFVVLKNKFYFYRSTGNESLSQRHYPNIFDIQVKLHSSVIWYCESVLSQPFINIKEVYLRYFKSLLYVIDEKKEKNNWLKRAEFQSLLRILSENRKLFNQIQQLEFFLLAHNMYWLDFSLRRIKCFVKKRSGIL